MAVGNDGRRAKTAHVNMMTDTIINNIPAEGLRVIMRSLLVAHPEITSTFEEETRRYIQDVALPKEQSRSSETDVAALKTLQRTVRCMQGCGLSIQSVPLTGDLAVQGLRLQNDNPDDEVLASIDGDVVQLVTAIEKGQLAAGRTTLPDEDKKVVEDLRQSLIECLDMTGANDQIYPYGRALTATSILLGVPVPQLDDVSASIQHDLQIDLPELKETFELQGRKLPRIFSGLWQMSSPSWGWAPTWKIIAQFSKYVSAGMIAFDMADHYGDAEITFVSRATVQRSMIPEYLTNKGSLQLGVLQEESNFRCYQVLRFQPNGGHEGGGSSQRVGEMQTLADRKDRFASVPLAICE
jgi:hypothetical protein